MKNFLLDFLLIFCLIVQSMPSLYGQEFRGLTNISKLQDSSYIQNLIKQGTEIKQHNSDSAAILYNRALSISKHYDYSAGIVNAAIELGSLYHFTGAYHQAINSFNLVLSYKRNSIEEMKAYSGLATAYAYLGDCKKSVEYYIKALTIGEQTDTLKSSLKLQLYHQLSFALHQCQEEERALFYIDRALPIARETGNIEMQSKLLNVKGVSLFYGRDQLSGAIACLDSAILLARSVNNYPLLHPALVNKGSILVRNGRAKEAIPLFYEAKELTEKWSINLNDRIGTISALGEAYLSLGNYKDAERYFLEAWQYADRLPKERRFLLYKLSELYEAMGDYKNAFAYQKEYMKLSDTLHSKEVILAINTMETKYQLLEKDRKITQDQLQISKQQQKIAGKNMWIILTSGISIISILLFIIFYNNQRQKNNRLISNQKIAQLQAKIEGEEEERQRLAQELHDGINSQLSGAKSYLLTMGSIFPEIKNAPVFKETNNTLNDISENIRKVAHNLLPGELTEQHLPAAIQKFCTTLTRDTGIEIEFHAYGTFTDTSPTLALNIYRIIQELLHNVVKHAKSREAIVLLNEHPDEISLIVEDSGKGMDPATQKEGIGLRNIYTRVKAQAGTINIESGKGKGTIISIFFPKKTTLKNKMIPTNI